MTERATAELESWLVLRAQSGEMEALDGLLKAVQDPLYRYIFSLVRETSLAEDVLQEVFMRIYRKLNWLRERPWADQVRDEAALKMISLPPPREEFAPEVIERLPQLVANISPASRAVIVLYYLHEMSLDDTAAVLEIPIGTVKSRLAYGLESLRRQFRKQGQT